MKKIYEKVQCDIMQAFACDVVCQSPEYDADGTDDMGSDIWPIVRAE